MDRRLALVLPTSALSACRSVPDDPADFDYDLELYIRTGRLLWIAPGDETLTLRSTVEGCPFLGLPGMRHPVGLRDGVIWDSLVILPEEV